MKRRCLGVGGKRCDELVVAPRHRCPDCQREHERSKPYLRGSTGDWRRRRRIAIAKALNRCQGCGVWGTIAQPLQVHHVDGNPRNNRAENLRPLCLECHVKEGRAA